MTKRGLRDSATRDPRICFSGLYGGGTRSTRSVGGRGVEVNELGEVRGWRRCHAQKFPAVLPGLVQELRKSYAERIPLTLQLSINQL